MSSALSQDVKITRVANAAAAAQTEVLSSVLDMAGYDGVVFVAMLGDVASTSVLTLTLKENTASSTSSPTPTAVTGGATSAFTADATSADNKVLMVDLVKNAMTKRYIFASLTRTTADAAVDGIVAIQYRARSKPVSQPASVIASAVSGA